MVAIHTHMLGAATRFHLLDFNMDVCSGFMAAVVTGRNKTSGHLTSLGIRVGAGMGPAKAELFCFGFSRSCHGRRRMEGLMLWRPPRLNGVRPNMDQRERERFLQEVWLISEHRGLIADLLSGCRVEEGCSGAIAVIIGG